MRHRHTSHEEGGFTIIELMVVVLVIAVLVGIALPGFLKAQNGAKQKSAQASARSALSAVKTLQSEQESYWVSSNGNTLSLLQSAEPSLQWVPAMGTPSGSVDSVSWASTTTEFVIAVRSQTGDCFYIKDNLVTGTWFGKTIGTDVTGCDADGAGPVWKQSQGEGWPRDAASAA